MSSNSACGAAPVLHFSWEPMKARSQGDRLFGQIVSVVVFMLTRGLWGTFIKRETQNCSISRHVVDFINDDFIEVILLTVSKGQDTTV